MTSPPAIAQTSGGEGPSGEGPSGEGASDAGPEAGSQGWLERFGAALGHGSDDVFWYYTGELLALEAGAIRRVCEVEGFSVTRMRRGPEGWELHARDLLVHGAPADPGLARMAPWWSEDRRQHLRGEAFDPVGQAGAGEVVSVSLPYATSEGVERFRYELGPGGTIERVARLRTCPPPPARRRSDPGPPGPEARTGARSVTTAAGGAPGAEPLTTATLVYDLDGRREPGGFGALPAGLRDLVARERPEFAFAPRGEGLDAEPPGARRWFVRCWFARFRRRRSR